MIYYAHVNQKSLDCWSGGNFSVSSG